MCYTHPLPAGWNEAHWQAVRAFLVARGQSIAPQRCWVSLERNESEPLLVIHIILPKDKVAMFQFGMPDTQRVGALELPLRFDGR